MNFSISHFFHFVLILLSIIKVSNSFTLDVVVENQTINALTTYTFTYTFPDSTARTEITITFPQKSDISSISLQIFQNSSPTPLSIGTQYSINSTSKVITIINPIPFFSNMTFKITSIKNPPSSIQYQFNSTVLPNIAQISPPFVTFIPGRLQACDWTFGKFTGSSDSNVTITAKISNPLSSGNNIILVQFPSLYQDSDNKYLTKNSSSITLQYSFDNTTFFTSTSPTIQNNKIKFSDSLTTNISSNSILIIKINGIQNPQTQNPNGLNFKVTTADSSEWFIDTITECQITPLTLLQLPASFSFTNTVYVNDALTSPRIVINVAIPFTISVNDILQLTHPSEMPVNWVNGLIIRFQRFVSVNFTIDNSKTTSITKQFRFISGTQDGRQNATSSSFSFQFNTLAPSSQTPWQFTFTLKRNSGAYVEFKPTLLALSKQINTVNANLSISSNEMAVSTQYKLDYLITNPITSNGRILIKFNNDFTITNGICIASILGIIYDSNCDLITINGTNYLQYKLSGPITTIIPANTKIQITYPSIVTNALYPRQYSFGLYLYYNNIESSLVQSSSNFASVSLTTHYNKRSKLLQNDFTVFENKVITIKYINQVIIPHTAIIKITLPIQIYSYSFSNLISLNSTNYTVNGVTRNQTQRSFELTLNLPLAIVNNQTEWLIPITVTMPIVKSDYKSIIITVRNQSSTIPLEVVNQGLEVIVKYPAPGLKAVIQPKLNRSINAITNYQISIENPTPLAKNFYIQLTVPQSIGISSSLSCDSSSSGICKNIIQTGGKKLLITIQNSAHLLNSTYLLFTITISNLINKRSSGSSQNWIVETKSLINNIAGTMGYVSIGNTMTNRTLAGTKINCTFDKTFNYYKGNVENVVIHCVFHNDLIVSDYIQLRFTTQSYIKNPNIATLSCPSPSFVSCSIITSTSTLLTIKVLITGEPSTNKNTLRLQIMGLISYSNTFYGQSKVPILIDRYEQTKNLIDQGIFYYDISCNENQTIRDKKCKTCYNGKCLSCYDTMYILNNSLCVNSCPTQTQFRTINNSTTSTCQTCPLPCYTCESTVICKTCANTAHFLINTNWSCVSTCDTNNGFWINYQNKEQKMCFTCQLNCLQCNNNNVGNCLKCVSGYVLQNGQCKNGCTDPNSFIFSGKCISCDPACISCDGIGSNQCKTCRQLYYKDNGYCVLTCPSNTFKIETNKTCGCLSNCLTCTSQSPTYCTSCQDDTNYLYEGKCITSCPNLTFQSLSTCIPCPSNCIQCTSGSICKTCQDKFYFYSSKCYFDCNQISLQFDAVDKTCVLCPTGCDRCNGIICQSCLPAYTLKDTICDLACKQTNTCAVESPIPQKILPLPATLSFVIWIIIVYAAKYFLPKLYTPYSIVYLGAVIQILLILTTLSYNKDLIQTPTIKRLLQQQSIIQRLLLTIDYSFRQTVLSLLLVTVIINYLSNIIFTWIFCKYLRPLVQSPKQIDYITMSTVGVIGLVTNYRFCLLFFSKMFPKPQILIDYAARLTPVHYLCVTSIIFGIIPLAAGGMIVKNQTELTDIFMLGVDLIIIELLLIGISIWMIAVDKNKQYYDNQIQKYHIEEVYKTQQTLNDQKNHSKHNLIRDSFDTHQQNLDDSVAFDKKLLSSMNKKNNLNLDSDSNQPPLSNKVSKVNKLDMEKINIKTSNKDQNTMDDINASGITYKKNKIKGLPQNGDLGLKNRFKQEPNSNTKLNKSVFQNNNNEDDQNILPQTLNKKKSNNIKVNQPQSDDIPNLPLNQSVFHQRSSSEFGHKLRKSLNKDKQKSQIIRGSKQTSPIKKHSSSSYKMNMKKKNNKIFQSQGFDSQINNDQKNQIQQNMDFASIIQSKIIVVQNKNQKDNLRKSFQSDNISGILKKQDNLSENNNQINQQISPSWFNIQNQRFDFDDGNDDFSEN